MLSGTVYIPVSVETAVLLERLKKAKDESFDFVISRMHLMAWYNEPSAKPGGRSTDHRAETTRHSYNLLGELYFAETKKDVLFGVLKRLAELDEKFLPQLSMEGGRNRRHAARTREGVYSFRPDLAVEFTEEITPGWYVGTNYSGLDIKRILKDACRVAGLAWGTDLVIEFAV